MDVFNGNMQAVSPFPAFISEETSAGCSFIFTRDVLTREWHLPKYKIIGKVHLILSEVVLEQKYFSLKILARYHIDSLSHSLGF